MLGFRVYYQFMLQVPREGQIRNFETSMRHTIARYGLRPELLTDLAPELRNMFPAWVRSIMSRRSR